MRDRKRRRLQHGADNDPHHGDPHGQSAARLLAEEEGEDASREAAQVVDGHDNAFETRRRVVEGVEEVGVPYDACRWSLSLPGICVCMW